MLMSVDGRISTGANDTLDFDQDLPKIDGVREGLGQYYEIEQTTDLWALNSGRVQAKMGVNEKPVPPKTPVSFVIIDNHHLNEHGIRYFCGRSQKFVLVTTNPRHPAFESKEENLSIIFQETLDLNGVLEHLRENYGCERITLQTGGTLNGMFLREKLLDYVDIVVAPVLVGGQDTSALIDGKSLTGQEELDRLGILELTGCETLKHSYLRLKYKVVR